MASTWLELKTMITDALGRADANALTIAGRGVNFGQLMAAILYDPPELQTTGSLTVSASGTSVSLSTLTNLLSLIKIYNSTASKDVFIVPYDKFTIIVPTGAGNVLYAAKFGTTLYTRPTPTVSNTLTASYRKYPSPLVADGTSIDFDHYDEFITTVGLRYAWACFEEPESSDLFSKVGELIGVPLAIGTKIRNQLEGVLRDGYKI